MACGLTILSAAREADDATIIHQFRGLDAACRTARHAAEELRAARRLFEGGGQPMSDRRLSPPSLRFVESPAEHCTRVELRISSRVPLGRSRIFRLRPVDADELIRIAESMERRQ
jgi:hypothetical protein